LKDLDDELAKITAMRIIKWIVAAPVVALAFAGCGSSSTKLVTDTSPVNSGATTPSTPSTKTSRTAAPATTTTTTAAPAHCTASTLSLSFLGQQGATGHGVIGFALRNVGGHSCRTLGYPGVLFLSRSGQALPTAATRTTHDFAGSAPEVSLDVAPGARLSFRLTVTHGINSSAGCTTAYGLQVIPPDDTATVRTSIPGGAYECGRATVSPLRPGTSAYP
jgi:hypothetical protein